MRENSGPQRERKRARGGRGIGAGNSDKNSVLDLLEPVLTIRSPKQRQRAERDLRRAFRLAGTEPGTRYLERVKATLGAEPEVDPPGEAFVEGVCPLAAECREHLTPVAGTESAACSFCGQVLGRRALAALLTGSPGRGFLNQKDRRP